MTRLWGDALRLALLTPWRLPRQAVLARLSEVLVGSFGLIVVTVACVGAAMCHQAAAQAMRLLGDQSFIGPEYIVLGFEAFGPLVVALSLVARVGAGFAAEIASLKGDGALLAMDLYGLRPAHTRLAPMGTACVVGGACLGLWAALTWEVVGMLVMWTVHGMSPWSFFHPEAIDTASVLLCVGKNAGMAALVFVTALRAGLAADAGSEAIGRATTRAVVWGVLGVLFANLCVDVCCALLGGPA